MLHPPIAAGSVLLTTVRILLIPQQLLGGMVGVGHRVVIGWFELEGVCREGETNANALKLKQKICPHRKYIYRYQILTIRCRGTQDVLNQIKRIRATIILRVL